MTTMPEAAASSAAPQNDDVLLDVKNLKMHFPVGSGFLSRKPMGYVKAVDDVSFTAVSYTHLTLPTPPYV